MKYITLLFASISTLLPQLVAAINGTLVAQDFRELLSQGSGIYLASDENWENETTQRWNLWNAPTYVVSVKPALVEDVQKVVGNSFRSLRLDTFNLTDRGLGPVCLAAQLFVPRNGRWSRLHRKLGSFGQWD